MPPSEPKLRLNGQNVRLILFLGGVPQPQSELLKSAKIDEVQTEHRDSFLGADADDPDEQTDGWDADLEFYKADSALLKALLDQKAKRAARQPFPEVSLGMIFENRDGTQDAVMLQKCATKIGIDVSGRKERVMERVSVRAKYLKPFTI